MALDSQALDPKQNTDTHKNPNNVRSVSSVTLCRWLSNCHATSCSGLLSFWGHELHSLVTCSPIFPCATTSPLLHGISDNGFHPRRIPPPRRWIALYAYPHSGYIYIQLECFKHQRDNSQKGMRKEKRYQVSLQKKREKRMDRSNITVVVYYNGYIYMWGSNIFYDSPNNIVCGTRCSTFSRYKCQ